MANFDKAITVVLQHEGGWVNNPNDPGGATNFGISLRFLKDHPDVGDFDHDGDVDVEDIRNMTVDEAKTIYKELWWDRFHYGDFLRDEIATKVFDTAVNMGAKRAGMLLQQSCCDLGVNLTVDGIVGPATIHVVNQFADDESAPKLLDAFREHQKQYYLHLIEVNPKLAVFKRGWLNRAAS